MGEVERRGAVDRVERSREGVHARHVIAQLVGHLECSGMIDRHSVLRHLGFDEGDPIGRSRRDVHLDDLGGTFHQLVRLRAHDREHQGDTRGGVAHPREHLGHLIG